MERNKFSKIWTFLQRLNFIAIYYAVDLGGIEPPASRMRSERSTTELQALIYRVEGYGIPFTYEP